MVAIARIVVGLYQCEKFAQFQWIEGKLVHQIVVVEKIQAHVQQWVTCNQSLIIGDKLITRLGVKMVQVTQDEIIFSSVCEPLVILRNAKTSKSHRLMQAMLA